MSEDLNVLVIGAGCSICGVVLSDEWLIIKEKQPFIIDEKMLQLVRKGEWDIIKDMLQKVVGDWDGEQAEFRKKMNAEGVEIKGEVVPFLMTSERNYIANDVYVKMEEMRKLSE